MNEIAKLVEATRSKTLLYVEDDTDIRINVAELLGNLFAEVISAKDGVEGLEEYKKRQFDIVVTDIKMPRMNGILLIEAIQEIKKDQMIIITTAHDEKEYQEKFEELGIAHILYKPITFESLLKTLQEITK